MVFRETFVHFGLRDRSLSAVKSLKSSKVQGGNEYLYVRHPSDTSNNDVDVKTSTFEHFLPRLLQIQIKEFANLANSINE